MGTQTHREQVRQKIIQSALQLFNKHGFTAASIDDIMGGAGMTRGGFYSYFQSKDALLRLAGGMMDQTTDMVIEKILEETPTAVEGMKV